MVDSWIYRILIVLKFEAQMLTATVYHLISILHESLSLLVSILCHIRVSSTCYAWWLTYQSWYPLTLSLCGDCMDGLILFTERSFVHVKPFLDFGLSATDTLLHLRCPKPPSVLHRSLRNRKKFLVNFCLIYYPLFISLVRVTRPS